MIWIDVCIVLVRDNIFSPFIRIINVFTVLLELVFPHFISFGVFPSFIRIDGYNNT